MKHDVFAISKRNNDGNMYPKPTDAQEGLNILIKHFLGEDWYVVDPLRTVQVNTIAVYEILYKYQKKSLWEKIRSVLWG